jgi:cell volume regulation protein A
VAQISLFALLGMLVYPSGLGDVAGDSLLLSAVLIFVARPLAAFAASALSPFSARERLMLGWAGLRGAIPIWLATFPVVAGVAGSEQIFNTIFFVVVTSTLIQGTTFEPLARRLGVVGNEPALRPPLIETGIIRELGGESFVWRVRPGDAAAGHSVKELELPREALVNLIVRDGSALPPRGSTEIEEGDELHIVVRMEALEEVRGLAERWRRGPLGTPAVPALPLRGAPQVFSVRPWNASRDGDPGNPRAIEQVPVAQRLRTRRDGTGSLVTLADGRYAATGADVLAVGGRRRLAEWCSRRVARPGTPSGEVAWWQELAGALSAPATPPDADVS